MSFGPGTGGARVSVVLTTYDHEKFIVASLDGILSQQGGLLREIFICDDLSTDRTGEIADSYALARPGLITVLRPPRNRNDSAETRRAVEMCTGEFIAFLDGDDYWTDPEKLARQVAFLDAHTDASMCFHDCIVVDEDDRVIRDTYRPGRAVPAVGTFRDIAKTNYIVSLSPLIRRSALADLPEWADPYEWGDWTLYLFAALHGWIGYLPARMGAYRRHSGASLARMGLDQRLNLSLGYLNDFAARFPPRHRGDFERGIASACADLIGDELRGGTLKGAARSLSWLFRLDSGLRGARLAGLTILEVSRRMMGKISGRPY